MSASKTSSSTSSTTRTEVIPTAMETALNQQTYDMIAFQQPYQKDMYKNLSANINAILTGQNTLAKGIGGITAEDTQRQVNDAMRTVMPQFQAQGLMDSGSAIQMSVRTAADIQNANAQFNVSAAQNLFNLAVGGQSNLQNQGTALTSVLGAQLAGLRSTSSSSSGKSTSMTMGADLSKAAGAMMCWVAAEIFGGWHEYKTEMARIYINNLAPKWFRRFYIKHGEAVARFISDKPVFKMVLRPLFELFVILGEKSLTIRRA